MPRRNALNSICHNLLHTFLSRNNDIDGYWGIGMLYLLAARDEALTVHIDLINESNTTTDSEQSLLASALTTLGQHYRQTLLSMLDTQCLPHPWLKQAYLTLVFECKHADLTTIPIGPSKPYCCTFTIISDLGRKFEHTMAGYAWKHDPRREGRSIRT